MQAAEQIQIGQNSLIIRGQGEKVNRLILRVAQKVSIARHQGLLSLLLKEVQETLKGRQNTAGPAWEEHRRIFGYRPSSGASRSRPGSGNSRGRGRRQPAAFSPYFHRKNTWTRAFVCLAFSEQNALPSTSERITLTLNGLTSVIDCGTPSKPPPKCTKCCSICCKRKLTKSSVSSLALHCNLLDRSWEFLSRAKKSVRSI